MSLPNNLNAYEKVNNMKNMLGGSFIELLKPNIKTKQNESFLKMLEMTKDKPEAYLELLSVAIFHQNFEVIKIMVEQYNLTESETPYTNALSFYNSILPENSKEKLTNAKENYIDIQCPFVLMSGIGGDIEIFKYLLNHKLISNINEIGTIGLSKRLKNIFTSNIIGACAYYGKYELLSYLLKTYNKNELDINVITTEKKSKQGRIPLSKEYTGCTPSLLAVAGMGNENDILEILKILENYKSDFDTKDVNKENIIHYAVRNNKLNVIKFLIEKLNLKNLADEFNKDGLTPLSLARQYKYENIINYLGKNSQDEEKTIEENLKDLINDSTNYKTNKKKNKKKGKKAKNEIDVPNLFDSTSYQETLVVEKKNEDSKNRQKLQALFGGTKKHKKNEEKVEEKNEDNKDDKKENEEEKEDEKKNVEEKNDSDLENNNEEEKKNNEEEQTVSKKEKKQKEDDEKTEGFIIGLRTKKNKKNKKNKEKNANINKAKEETENKKETKIEKEKEEKKVEKKEETKEAKKVEKKEEKREEKKLEKKEEKKETKKEVKKEEKKETKKEEKKVKEEKHEKEKEKEKEKKIVKEEEPEKKEESKPIKEEKKEEEKPIEKKEEKIEEPKEPEKEEEVKETVEEKEETKEPEKPEEELKKSNEEEENNNEDEVTYSEDDFLGKSFEKEEQKENVNEEVSGNDYKQLNKNYLELEQKFKRLEKEKEELTNHLKKLYLKNKSLSKIPNTSDNEENINDLMYLANKELENKNNVIQDLEKKLLMLDLTNVKNFTLDKLQKYKDFYQNNLKIINDAMK